MYTVYIQRETAVRRKAGSPGIRKEGTMKKKLSCRALGMNCGFEVHDESEEEILRAIGDHFKRIHKAELTEALRRKANDLIRLEGVS